MRRTDQRTFQRIRQSVTRLPSTRSACRFPNQMLYLDTKIFMVSLNLTYNDKMSMASSVEVRVPFLDRELAEFVAWNVPPNLKLKGLLRPTTKYILRKAMQDVLPRRSVAATEGGFRGSGRLLVGARPKRNGGRCALESQLRRVACSGPEAVRAGRRAAARHARLVDADLAISDARIVDADVFHGRVPKSVSSRPIRSQSATA